MKITLNQWKRYRDTLRKLGETAENEFMNHFFKNGKGLAGVTVEQVEDYAYALVSKYGEGSAELACRMYDAIASLQSANVLSAVPADVATRKEVSEAVRECVKTSSSGQLLIPTIKRLIKQASADTMLQNAIRDGAEWAWIPSGDTCAFCLTLASRGWQKASKGMLKNGHAQHIHSNCDCNFAVRFSPLEVDGYDSIEYMELYQSADGKKPKDKINAIRRASYKLNAEKIRAQKRDAYQKRKEKNF